MIVHKTAGGVEYEQHEPDVFGHQREIEVPARVDAEQTARLLIRMERMLELAEQERDINDHIAQEFSDTARENYRRVRAAEAKIDELDRIRIERPVPEDYIRLLSAAMTWRNAPAAGELALIDAIRVFIVEPAREGGDG